MAKTGEKKLTEKQQRFVDLWTGNAMETAKLAGYKDVTKAGNICLKNTIICQKIKARRAAEIKPHIATRMDRQKFWSDTMYDSELDIKDRLQASNLLGKSEGDFLERHHHTGDTTLTISWQE